MNRRCQRLCRDGRGIVRRPATSTRRAGAACGLATLVLLATANGCNEPNEAPRTGRSTPRTLVLGMDGLDPDLLQKWMEEGRLPNFQRVAASGCFTRLGTSMPPQSPVAWSNFIAGADPATHQIYDFIHRRVDPKDPNSVVELYLSTSDLAPDRRWYHAVLPEALPIPGTSLQLPLLTHKPVSLRRGESFWDYLVRAGVNTTIYRMPANYPPVRVKGRGTFHCLCGMGTPDIMGGYGECTNFKEDMASERRLLSGAVLVRLDVRNDRAVTRLVGPPNPLARAGGAPAGPEDDRPALEAPIEIVRDPTDPCAAITLDGTTVLLKAGEWSDWIRFAYRPAGDRSIVRESLGLHPAVPAMVRMYLKEVHPNLNLYVSAPNIDPVHPATPISTPTSFSRDIASRTGDYYTTGIPEDTKALVNNILTEDEFLEMVGLLRLERTRQYHDALARFHSGFLFFYFGHTDQLAHMFWRDIDPQHPGRIPEQDGKYEHVIRDAYEEMDVRVGEALAALRDGDTLIIMSDHGFSSFRRGLNVNTWLARSADEHGPFLALNAPQPVGASRSSLLFVDWDRTRAYAVGINSIYLNMQGREKKGIVTAAQRRPLLDAISQRLLELRDDDGTPVVAKVYIVEDEFPSSDPVNARIAPDILVGYARNYRGSWATTTGGYRNTVIEDNRERWSGDHCIAAYLVPGVFLSNRAIGVTDPNLIDMAPTILGLYGIAPPATMNGRDLFAATARSTVARRSRTTRRRQSAAYR